MKYIWRKLREDEQDGLREPCRQLRGDNVTMREVREHFRKKICGQPIENLPAPTRSEAPSPVDSKRQSEIGR